uniref:hypothetical protein n=1 Tax=Microbacterium sp. MMO-64 TaxID=3081282 RepID=UPI003016051F
RVPAWWLLDIEPINVESTADELAAARGRRREPSPLTVQTREVKGNITHAEFGRPHREDVVPRPLAAIGAVR